MRWSSVAALCSKVLQHWGVDDGFIAFPARNGTTQHLLVRASVVLCCVIAFMANSSSPPPHAQYSPGEDKLVTVADAGGDHGGIVIALPTLPGLR